MQAYLSLLDRDPIIVNVVTTFAVSYLSSAVAQKITKNPIEPINCMMYAVASTVITIFYLFYLQIITKKSYSIIAQVVIETVLFGIVGSFLFVHLYSFLLDTCMKEKYCYNSITKGFPKVMIASLKVWVPVNFIRAKYFAPKYRIILGVVISFFYNIYIAKILAGEKKSKNETDVVDQ